jgi:hypothetical protein
MPLLLARAGAQDHSVFDARRKLLLEAVEMIIALRQYQGRSSTAKRVDDILADSTSSRRVINQLLIQSLKFDALVRIRTPGRLEGGRLNEHQMLEWARRGLCASIDLMSNRTALHEDDRMVIILAYDGGRQAKDESGLGVPCNLFETVRRQMVAFVRRSCQMRWWPPGHHSCGGAWRPLQPSARPEAHLERSPPNDCRRGVRHQWPSRMPRSVSVLRTSSRQPRGSPM